MKRAEIAAIVELDCKVCETNVNIELLIDKYMEKNCSICVMMSFCNKTRKTPTGSLIKSTVSGDCGPLVFSSFQHFDISSSNPIFLPSLSYQ